MLSSKGGRAAIREELIHVKQKRIYGEPKNEKELCLREIEADKILLKNATKWKLTEREIEKTKLLMKDYSETLNRLEGYE